jgi:hypothetical protein
LEEHKRIGFIAAGVDDGEDFERFFVSVLSDEPARGFRNEEKNEEAG